MQPILEIKVWFGKSKDKKINDVILADKLMRVIKQFQIRSVYAGEDFVVKSFPVCLLFSLERSN